MQGLQTWDANGKMTLDTTFTTVKILKIVAGIYQQNKTRSVSFAHELIAEQTPFYIIKPVHATYASSTANVSVYFKKDRCTVHFSSSSTGYDFSNYEIYIGVY